MKGLEQDPDVKVVGSRPRDFHGARISPCTAVSTRCYHIRFLKNAYLTSYLTLEGKVIKTQDLFCTKTSLFGLFFFISPACLFCCHILPV